MIFSSLAYAILGLVSTMSFLVTVPLSLGEGAMTRLTQASAKDLEEAGAKHAAAIHHLAEHRREVLAYIRSTRSVTVAAALGSAALLASQIPWLWWAVALALTATGGLALMLLTLPANWMGRRYPETTIRYLAGFITRVWRLGKPIGRMWKAARGPAAQTDQEARDEVANDLREMVDQMGEPDTIEAADREMIWSVFEMGRTLVREVMVPRVDMVTIGSDESLDNALTLFVRSGFSRIPVVGEDSDDVRGILYLKDVLRRIHEDETGASRLMTAEQAQREAQFIPETNLVDDTLREMQAGAYHIAILVDEYGVIAGLVTLEDLVEEVIGEVADEHDHDEREPEAQPDGSWVVAARLPLVDLNDLLGTEIEDEDVDTVGGLLTKAVGMVPLVGAEAEIAGLRLRAVEAGGRRRQVSVVQVWVL
ncbi:HlyC/CorC family transporter [Mobiluncus mulieris]|uniref:HlyC/CorC family transporter n=1 Tax=Mobiluncus mulieris TaxID=2052 RepID=A0A848RS44_9ACTO|nr:hemolysin family protein [Mobiluncus mulieris]EFN93406.1 CBS domain protein [Mobiluncus mulieris FB024-16]MCU9996474.1 HlyC/CorC family transporter [Mobiluncus mulieris]NMW60621.1 HlyC/CorC family transporter [Mobiluncus mulieris]NMW93748.1 HlyC/CorC family transporter [Mobiluncus mulieris]